MLIETSNHHVSLALVIERLAMSFQNSLIKFCSFIFYLCDALNKGKVPGHAQGLPG